MSPVTLSLNIVWIVFGGLAMAFGWFVAGLVMIVTIIGIPWAWAAFRIAIYTLFPFGRRVARGADRPSARGRDGGAPAFVGNVVWLVLAGWWLAAGHLLAALGYAVTVIGLPFAWAHLKLAGLSLWPINAEIVDAD